MENDNSYDKASWNQCLGLRANAHVDVTKKSYKNAPLWNSYCCCRQNKDVQMTLAGATVKEVDAVTPAFGYAPVTFMVRCRIGFVLCWHL